MARQAGRFQAKPIKSVSDWYEHRGRHWLRNLLVLSFALAVFIPGGALLVERLDPANLPIRNIEIRGDLSRVDVEAIKSLVGPYVSEGVMQADVHHVAAVVARQPWVKRAWVRKRWPDTLEVQIAAYQPVARWGRDQWLDGDAIVFKGSPQADESAFAILSAPQGLEKRVLSAYQLYRDRLAEVGLMLARVSVDERRAWHLQTRRGLSIELGRKDLERRLGRFLTVYRKQLAPGAEGAKENQRLVRADMRYPHGLAVRWAPNGPSPATGSEHKG